MTHKSGHMCAPHLSAREQISKQKHCDSKIDAVTQHNEKKNMYVYVGRSCDFNRRQHPSKTFHKDIRDCREAQERNHSNRLCSTIFMKPPSRRRLGVPRERSHFLSLRLIHHPRMVDPPGLAIDKQNVQACHVVTHGIWEDTEKCWVVLLNPRLVLRCWQTGLGL